MSDNIEDINKSVKAALYERIESPLFVGFSLSWCVVNFEVILVLVSGIDDPQEKIAKKARYAILLSGEESLALRLANDSLKNKLETLTIHSPIEIQKLNSKIQELHQHIDQKNSEFETLNTQNKTDVANVTRELQDKIKRRESDQKRIINNFNQQIESLIKALEQSQPFVSDASKNDRLEDDEKVNANQLKITIERILEKERKNLL